MRLVRCSSDHTRRCYIRRTAISSSLPTSQVCGLYSLDTSCFSSVASAVYGHHSAWPSQKKSSITISWYRWRNDQLVVELSKRRKSNRNVTCRHSMPNDFYRVGQTLIIRAVLLQLYPWHFKHLWCSRAMYVIMMSSVPHAAVVTRNSSADEIGTWTWHRCFFYPSCV